MIRTIRDIQIRINSLGILQDNHQRLLVVDGMNGPATRRAIELAKRELGVETTEDLFDPSGINRVHWHWTASKYNVSHSDRKHYNDVFDQDGIHYDGAAPALHQSRYIPGRIGVSHTYMANTGSIGLAVTGMHGAVNYGFSANSGEYPLTWAGIDAMLERTVEYCRHFDIKVSPWTTLSHAEVQGNIGIQQRGKWDIQVLPDDPTRVLKPRQAGDILRERMIRKFV